MATLGGARSALASHRLRLLAALLLSTILLLVLLLPGGGRSAPSTTAPTPSAGVASPGLPFAMPATAQLRASPRKVFAHYLPSLPVSLDNAPGGSDYYASQYLMPDGEGGAHRAYGGFLRDRPLPRAPLTGDWQLQDLEAEVRQAISAGIDGFTVDLLQLPGGSDNRVSQTAATLLAAAHAVDPGFAVMLMPDMSGSLGQVSQQVLADYLASLAAAPSAYHLPDGRLVVSPFDAEERDATWWRGFLDVMKDQHGLSVAFLPVFLDARDREAYEPLSYGLANWGDRNPVDNDDASTDPASPLGRIALTHRRGLTWMQPVSMQDERPRSGSFQESEATTNLRRTWQIAINGNADLVQMVTWNDYAEGSQLAPSAGHDWTLLDISAYYLTWFKTGVRPTLLRDVAFVSHRIQSVAALPTTPETELMTLRGNTAAVDAVEVLSFLTRPGAVRLDVGGHITRCEVPAGVSTCTAPLSTGPVSAAVLRGTTVAARVRSRFTVVARPTVQNLEYVVTSSLGTRPRLPAAAPPSGIPAPVATPTHR